MREVEMPIGYRLVALEEIDSTNSEAIRIAARGAAGGLWLVADRQVRGKGRSGRSWSSVSGNLYASLMLRLSCGPEIAQQLALLAGVAVIDAVGELRYPPHLRGRASDGGGSSADASASPPPRPSPVEGEGGRKLRLKWPNDVLAGEAKLGGILLESAKDLGAPGLVTVIGIGLNIAGSPQGLGRAVTSLAEQGIVTDRSKILSNIAKSMDSALSVWDEGAGFADIRRAWLERAGPFDELLTVNSGTGPITGRYRGLDDDGALLLADGLGVLHRFTYGDVSLARQGEAQ